MRRSPLFVLPLALFGAIAPLRAQIARGQVVDSVTQVPLAQAVVALADQDGAELARTVTDDEGLFLLRAPAAGEFHLRIEAEGYRRSTFPPFALGSSEMKGFMLLIASIAPPPPAPAIEDYIDELCPAGTVRPGRGAVMGFVRYAETQTPVANAGVLASWSAAGGVLAELAQGVDVGRASGEATTDSAGVYVACGVPIRTPLTFHAASGDLLSDFVTLRFDSGGVFVDDVFHTTTQSVMRQDFDLKSAAQRTAAVTGTVIDGESMEPLEGAILEVSETDLQTSTDADGNFTLTELPAGPVRLSVRHPGFQPLSRPIELEHGQTVNVASDVFLLATSPTELAAVVVEAERPSMRRPLTDFWERRERGVGAFMTRDEFEKQGNPQDVSQVLRRMPGVRVVNNPMFASTGKRFIVELRRGGPRTFGNAGRGTRPGGLTPNPCPPLYFIDRHFIGDDNTIDIDHILPLLDVEAIEAYGTVAGMPVEFNRPGATCGVILIWTR